MVVFHILLEEQAEGGLTAQCVEVPGAISEGPTVEEALANIRDAITGVLEVRRAKARAHEGPGVQVRTIEIEG